MISRKTTKEFVELAISFHGNKYDYSLAEYKNSQTKVKIICNEHGIFEQMPGVHLRKSGCKLCGITTAGKKQSFTLQEFIDKANVTHSNKYDYSLIAEYKNYLTKLPFVCKEHGIFYQSPKHHIDRLQGCSNCDECNVKNIQQFVSEAATVYNNLYNYSSAVYVNDKTKIEIICNKHGSFWQTPRSHLYRNGCPKCSKNISKPEVQWLDILNIPAIYKRKTLKINNTLFHLDAFVPESNTIYEFFGDYWHGNPHKYHPNNFNQRSKKDFGELYQKTIEKERTLKKAGYNVISIWESEFKKQYKDLLK